jgi:5'(3')-deoxyribonucleotidase
MVWQNIKGIELNNKLQELEREHLKLHNSYQNSLLEYEQNRNEKRIKMLGKTKLNMIETKREDFIYLNINKAELAKKFISKKP